MSTAIALPIAGLSFAIDIPWLSMTYRPWRLLLQIVSLPGVIGVFGTFFILESPKFLLSKGKEETALDVLRMIYKCNMGSNQNFSVWFFYIQFTNLTPFIFINLQYKNILVLYNLISRN